jgi:hypothetical protein
MNSTRQPWHLNPCANHSTSSANDNLFICGGKCPFEVEKRYQVLKDVSFLNHHFTKGTTVVFKDCSYHFHQGLTRYWFSELIGSESNAWHVFDNALIPLSHGKSFSNTNKKSRSVTPGQIFHAHNTEYVH